MTKAKRFVQIIPLGLVLVLSWLGMRLLDIDVSLGAPAAWVLASMTMLTIAVEFYRSSDIMLSSFKRDLLMSVIAVAALSAGSHLVWSSRPVEVIDGFIVVAIIFDATVSPINSYRSALRNIAAGVNSAPTDPTE